MAKMIRKYDPRSPNILEASNTLQTLTDFFTWMHDNDQHDRFVPQAMRDDLTYLKQKWEVPNGRDLNLQDMMRRINTYSSGRRRLDRAFAHPAATYFGPGTQINGECWPYRINMLRDGGHNNMEAGVCGTLAEGAYSLSLSDNSDRLDYADRDIQEIDEIDYVGIKSPSNEPTKWTKYLMKSLETRKPVRVYRSWRLPLTNKKRAGDGFRYDGVYTVIAKECLDASHAIWRFTLRRIDGQTPIRLDRPDYREQEAMLKLRNMCRKHQYDLDFTPWYWRF